ncbi:hypothetical protein TRFO_16545 [Tritrichomonas foetus]|uniref:DUF3447 domain-containing protein n=1 Tax=Tritrichomonas foetus TaxID=1144522 RepID=A0A1J4KUY7_9EUKA|nr:hypothetical protein TRFO_16545 [Tritrichomonas foetus]|eukprot:OHT13341.1 hypothetical protein TRFO_16545 [Tritrichomonas foetus]
MSEGLLKQLQLQYYLNNLDAYNIEATFSTLNDKGFIHDNKLINTLIINIRTSINIRPQQIDYLLKLCLYIKSVNPLFHQKLYSKIIQHFSRAHLYFIYHGYRQGLFKNGEIFPTITKIPRKKDLYNFLLWFAPEIEKSHKNILNFISKIKIFDETEKINMLNIQKIQENRDKENDNIFAAIKNDNVKLLIDEKPSASYKVKLNQYTPYDFLDNASILETCAFFGSYNCFDYLINCGFQITISNPMFHILHFAIAGGNTRLILHLLQNNICTDGALQCSIYFHRNEYIDLFSYTQISKHVWGTPIFQMCRSNNIYAFYALTFGEYSQKSNLKELDFTEKASNGETPLFCLIKNEFVELFLEIIKNYEFRFDETDDNGDTLLIRSIYSKNVELVEFLVNQNVNCNICNYKGHSPLSIAAWCGNLKIVKVLHHHSNDENKINAMINAIRHNNHEIIKYLTQDSFYSTKSHMYIDYVHSSDNVYLFKKYGKIDDSVINQLIQHDAKGIIRYINDTQSSLFSNKDYFIQALKNEAFNVAKQIISSDSFIFHDSFPFSSLINYNVFTKLYSRFNFDVNMTNSAGDTLLNFCAKNNFIPIVYILLKDHSLDMNITNNVNMNALQTAYHYQNYELYSILLKSLINGDFKGNINEFLYNAITLNDLSLIRHIWGIKGNKELEFDPLLLSIKYQNTKIIDFFINNTMKIQGETLLEMINSKDIWLLQTAITFIQQGKVDLNEQAFHEHNNFLIKIIEIGDADLLNCVLKKSKFDVNLPSKMNKYPLIYALKLKKIDIIKLLCERPDTDVNVNELYTGTPLIISIKNNYLEVAKYLINHPRIDLNLTDSVGDTPLMIAALNGNYEIMELLLSHPNVDIDHKNRYNKTAYSNATSSKIDKQIKEKIINLLVSKGCNTETSMPILVSKSFKDDDKSDYQYNHSFNDNNKNQKKISNWGQSSAKISSQTSKDSVSKHKDAHPNSINIFGSTITQHKPPSFDIPLMPNQISSDTVLKSPTLKWPQSDINNTCDTFNSTLSKQSPFKLKDHAQSSQNQFQTHQFTLVFPTNNSQSTNNTNLVHDNPSPSKQETKSEPANNSWGNLSGSPLNPFSHFQNSNNQDLTHSYQAIKTGWGLVHVSSSDLNSHDKNQVNFETKLHQITTESLSSSFNPNSQSSPINPLATIQSPFSDQSSKGWSNQFSSNSINNNPTYSDKSPTEKPRFKPKDFTFLSNAENHTNITNPFAVNPTISQQSNQSKPCFDDFAAPSATQFALHQVNQNTVEEFPSKSSDSNLPATNESSLSHAFVNPFANNNLSSNSIHSSQLFDQNDSKRNPFGQIQPKKL